MKTNKLLKRAFAVLLSAFLIIAVLSGCAASEITVPDVTGLSIEEAEKTINDAGLTMVVSRERFSNKTPEGYVDKMDTAAETVLKAGEEVKVVKSKGKGIQVPDMGVLTGAEAENLLTVLGLHCIVEEEYSDTVEKGNIISYTDGGATLPEGSDVTIVVSVGKQA